SLHCQQLRVVPSVLFNFASINKRPRREENDGEKPEFVARSLPSDNCRRVCG
ncbi:hypothetical protein scyTo_0013301, partial [Scyliorhinus torazame]|nr:hypothetical protein [Scyliorhinus torazame]